MNCSADALTPLQSETSGRAVITWAFACLAKCAINVLVERRVAFSATRTGRCHE